MIETTLGSWTALLLLGGLHGVNPGMGWLFAVALGLQERNGGAVWRSLLPLAVGHGLAIAAVLALAAIVGQVVPARTLSWLVAAALFGTALFHLRRHRHPRWGGMRVGMRDLAVWSFLMASAHGAGLMALPFTPAEANGVAEAHAAEAHDAARHAAGEHVPASTAGVSGSVAGGPHAAHTHAPSGNAGHAGLFATLVHTLGYLLATGLLATVVYYRLGLRLLQRAWINLDLVWAGALMLTALLIPLL